MKKKSILILLVICSIIFITTGTFAYYRYSVNGSIIGKTGNYTFNVTSNSTTTKDINLGSNLKPFDKGSFNLTVKLDNTDCDVYYTLKIEKTNLPKGFKFLSQDDNISPFSTHSKYFNASDTKTDTVTIYWYWDGNVDDENDNSFIGKTISANIVINSKQTNPAYMKNGYISINGGTEFWNDTYRPYVRTITFDNNLSNLPSSCTEDNLCWDISYSSTQKKKVYGYLTDTGLKDSTDNTKSLYNLYIVSEAQIFAPSNCRNIFISFSNLTQINFNDNFNTSNAIDMCQMFRGCSSLTSLDLSNFNTAKVSDMDAMFYECSSLKKIDLSNFNTAKVSDMDTMFYGCKSLTSLDLSSFNTAKVTKMVSMFLNCKFLTSLDLSNFNTSNVTDMYCMFCNCSSLTSLDLSNFNTAKVSDMDKMFYGCKSLTSLDLSNFNTSNVTNMSNMFNGCSSLISLDLSSFSTANVTDMRRMFENCSSLISLDLSGFNTSKVTDMMYMFYDCRILTTTINIMNANVTNYSSMFYRAATASGSKITVNYTSSASTIVDNMIATKSSKSNVIKGSIIPEYSITITGNDDIKYESNNRLKGTKVTLTSISGNSYVTSFKMNGTTINGKEFIMPDTDVTISDIATTPGAIYETNHYPYSNFQENVIIGEHTFEGAKSLTVILDYQTESTSYDYFLIYDSASATAGINNNKKYGGSTRTQETITINSNYIKITFKSDSSGNDYYGLKAIVIPNY